MDAGHAGPDAGSHILIGKAGGAAVQESLAAGTPLFFTQVIPGQEEGNARLVLENGAGVFGASAKAIAAAVRETLGGDGHRWETMAGRARALGNPDAAAHLANFVLTNHP